MIENDLQDFIIQRNVIRSYKGTKSRVVIPNGIIGIGPEAFYQNDTVTSVIMPDSVISVSRKAFSQCSNLKSVRFSKNIRHLGSEAFSYCFGLSTVTLYSGAKIIRPKAFYGCQNVKNIYLPDTVTEIGKESFIKYCLDCTIHAPLGSKAKEFATINHFETDQKNPPKRQVEPVLPNENNYKDPKAAHYFRTGNYGIEDDEVFEDEDMFFDEEADDLKAEKTAVRIDETVDLSGVTVDDTDADIDMDDEFVPEEPKPEISEEEELERRAVAKKRKDRIRRIAAGALLCIIVAGIAVLGIKYFIDYRDAKEEFMTALAPEELIIPFNMAYNYALTNDSDAFLKQAKYLGLDVNSQFGVQINDEFIQKYLQNGSLEGFIRRFSTIYTYGTKQEDFNTEGADIALEEIIDKYLVAFERGYFDTLKNSSGFYQKNPDAIPQGFEKTVTAQAVSADGSLYISEKTNKSECSYYGDFAVERKETYAYSGGIWKASITSNYYYKGSQIKNLPDFYHVTGNAEFIFALGQDENGHYLFYFVSDTAARYDKAIRLYDMSKYAEAQVIFEEIAGYEDADEMLLSCKYYNAANQYQNKNYALAYSLLADVVAVQNNRDAEELFSKVKEDFYQQGLDYYDRLMYDQSNEIFKILTDYKDSKEKIHIHNYTITIIEAASCSETGLMKKTCDCGKVVTEIIPSKGHDYESHVTVAPTCSAEGEKTSVCKVCGYIFLERIPTTEHTYTEATCTEAEYCTVCGYVHGDPLGHLYSDSTVCERCGYDYAENIRVIADCLPFDVGRYLWGGSHYIVSCSHRIVYNKSSDRMDMVITWNNSDTSALGYGSLSCSLVVNVYDSSGKLIKKDKDIYFSKGTATTYVYGVQDNMDYYVELELYSGSTKLK